MEDKINEYEDNESGLKKDKKSDRFVSDVIKHTNQHLKNFKINYFLRGSPTVIEEDDGILAYRSAIKVIIQAYLKNLYTIHVQILILYNQIIFLRNNARMVLPKSGAGINKKPPSLINLLINRNFSNAKVVKHDISNSPNRINDKFLLGNQNVKNPNLISDSIDLGSAITLSVNKS